MLSAIVLGAAVMGLGGFAAADEKDDYAKKIIGKWEITKTEGDEPIGTLVEFTKDGKLSITLKADGKEIKIDGTYKVEKDKLTTEATVSGKTEKDVDTIKKLTDDELQIENKDKKTITLKKKK
jgi:uncharacterized protein (TIGR03066 family)